MPVPTRLFADRRSGADQRIVPRRSTLTAVAVEQRRVLDRRRGPERRSTLDRRGRAARHPALESPGEHLRNGLQLLLEVSTADVLDPDRRGDLAAALARLRRALELLERRAAADNAPREIAP